MDDGVQPLLPDAAASASSSSYSKRPVDLRQISLSVGVGTRLRRSGTRPAVPRKASFTSVSINTEEEEEEEEDDRREIEKKKKLIKRIVQDRDLDALIELGGVSTVESFLISESESQITTNEVLEQSVRGVGFWGSHYLSIKELGRHLLKSLTSYTIWFLVIAADLSFAIGFFQQGLKDGWRDGVGTLVAVSVLVIVASFAHVYQKRAKEKEHMKVKNMLDVTVERNGERQMVSVSDVKEGEIIHLKKGDRVPADGLLIRGKYLILDEVFNSIIDPDRSPFLFSGSVVANGEVDMIAVSTGADTAAGKGLLDVVSHPLQETLFQSRINRPYEFIEKVSLAVSLMILCVVLTRLLCGKHDDYYNDKPETKGKLTVNVLKEMYVKFKGSFFVTVVIGIQHGMPQAITFSLLYWKRKMRSQGGECRNMLACGTLGLVAAICIDTTGELSYQEEEVEEIFIGEEKINSDLEFHPDILEAFERAAGVMVSVLSRKNLLSLFEKLGLRMNLESLLHKYKIIHHKVLSSINGALMRRTGDTEANVLHYNGDASTILNMCSQYYDIRGTIHDIEPHREFLERVISDMKTRGLTPIAFACKQTNEQVFEETRLKLLGFVGFKYSFQKLKKALMDLKSIGVRIILTSEDELSVATAFANNLEIECGLDNQAVVGERFREKMKNAEKKEKDELMKSISVMAKATFEDKFQILEVLKDDGEIVVSLGGLTSRDAPTLIKADIGMTQENMSTEVCRMVSDLTCKDPTSLNRILKYGRCVYLNIQKFYQVQLTASITGFSLTLIFTMVSGKSPITTLHLIWVTLIICLLGSIMMIMELNDEEVKGPIVGIENKSLITKLILKKIAFQVLFQVVIFLLLEYLGKKVVPHMEEDVKHTMISNIFIICQIANLLAVMRNMLRFELQSFWFLGSLVFVLAVQMMVIEFAASVVNGVKLSAVQWAICFSFAFPLVWACYIFFHLFLYLTSSSCLSP